jgi:hypothetical protein
VELASKPLGLHSVLPLPATYEGLVARLGQRGRRNIRYYRRKFENAGGRFVCTMTDAEFKAAAYSILEKAGTGVDAEKTNRFLSMLFAVERPIRSGLQDYNGEWLSVLGGWREGETGTVLFQMNNDRQYPRLSLGVLLKGYALESLILRGMKSVFFWAGISEPFDHLAKAVPAVSVYLDKPDFLWWGVRRIVRSARRFLTPDLMYKADWITMPPPLQRCPTLSDVC